jgi:hypothetical protein
LLSPQDESGDRPLYLEARLIGGVGWSSEVHDRRPWPFDDKVVTQELAPYLAGLAVTPDAN